MGTSNEIKNQKSSLWTTTLADIDKASFPTERDIKRTIKHIKDNNIDISKPTPEVEKLAKIFEAKPKK